MKVTIAENVLLVAPLEIGKDLTAGDAVEVDEGRAQDWIARGWAVAVPEVSGQRAEVSADP